MSLKPVLTSSFKLAGHSVVYLIGHLDTTNKIHGQPQLKCLIYHLLPCHLWPLCDLYDLWLWSGESPRWGRWLGLLSLRSHMWHLCFSPAAVTSEHCQHLTNVMSYQSTQTGRMFVGFQELIYWWTDCD